MQRARRRKAKRGGKVQAVTDHVTGMTLLAMVGSLLAVLLCLELIGPPPRWRIDVLWVHGHSRTVRVMAYALLLAGGASMLLLLSPKRRGWMIASWLAALALCLALYWDRLPILFDVVRRHAL